MSCPLTRRHTVSDTLSESDRLGLVARIDLVEGEGNRVTPVDYKRGRPPDNPEHAWEPERVQLCAQALLLREHGFTCDEGVLYFVQSKQRVPVSIDEELVRRTLELRDALRATAASGAIPPPLAGSTKCIRCSLAPICLPDETRMLAAAGSDSRSGLQIPPTPVDADNTSGLQIPPTPVRRILPARDDAARSYFEHFGAMLRRGRGLSAPLPDAPPGADNPDSPSSPSDRGCPAPPVDGAPAEPDKPLL
jgi:CRISPR-associated protein Cas1